MIFGYKILEGGDYDWDFECRMFLRRGKAED